ncbi:metal-dependent transcriptional regulator, partial [bacterium AH-315-J21]|nr:metal-dependent transcriptional regulator [bacterium AH-315-J21]
MATKKRDAGQLTIAQQDYLEAILRLQEDSESSPIRITDIASALGTKLPTVTRTIQRLTALGLTEHPDRGGVTLTATGRTIAAEITHRHEDLFDFFNLVLGLSEEISEQDTCQIEHGLSEESAQRLHEFMEYFHGLDTRGKKIFKEFQSQAGKSKGEFKNIPEIK